MTSSRLSAVVVVVLWGLITHGTYAGSGDEPHYLLAAYSFAFDGDFDLSNNYSDAATLIGGPDGLAPEAHARPGRDGRLRPIHDIGMPLAFAAYVRVAHPAARALASTVPPAWMTRAKLTDALLFRHLVSLAMILLSAVLAIELFRVLQETGIAARLAWWWTLLVVLSPPVAAHGFLFFTEILSALIVLLVFRRLYQPELTRAEAVAVGLGIGFLPLIHARNIPLALAFAVLAGVRLRKSPSSLGALSAAMLLGFALRTFVTWHFWGTVFMTPHARPGDWTGIGAAVIESATRLLGWAWDREYGLFAYAPIYLLAVPGMVALARRNRAFAHGIFLVVGVYIAAIATPVVNAHGWTANWSPAARFLVPVVPLLAIAACAAWPLVRPLGWTLVAMQLGLNALVWQQPKLLWNDGDGASALCGVRALPQCNAWPSMVTGSAADWAGAILASMAVVLLTLWMVRRSGVNPGSDRVEHDRVHVPL